MTLPVVVFIPPSCCGAGYFHRLHRVLAGRIDFRAVELPGHGRRFAEPFLTQAEVAVRDVAAQIEGPVDAVYGESLGAYIALALVAGLDQYPPPLLLTASNTPPSVRTPIDLEGLDSIEVAVARLAEMGGDLPAEGLSDSPIAAHALQMIGADLHLSQSFIDATRELAVGSDIRVLAGADDTGLTELGSWGRHTIGRCEVIRMPGGHLLSRTNAVGVAALLESALATTGVAGADE